MISGIGNCNSYSSYLRSQAMSRSDPADMFGDIDSDDSGGVSQTELEDWIEAMSDKTGVSVDTTDAVSTWDEDEDGELNSDELGAFMKETMPPPPGMMGMGPAAPAEGLFQALDTDESDGISESELTQWADDMSEETGETISVGDTFADYDLDDDDELSADELDSFLTANGIGGAPPAPSEDEDKEYTGVSAADSDDVISEYDTNGDGVTITPVTCDCPVRPPLASILPAADERRQC